MYIGKDYWLPVDLKMFKEGVCRYIPNKFPDKIVPQIYNYFQKEEKWARHGSECTYEFIANPIMFDLSLDEAIKKMENFEYSSSIDEYHDKHADFRTFKNDLEDEDYLICHHEDINGISFVIDYNDF